MRWENDVFDDPIYKNLSSGRAGLQLKRLVRRIWIETKPPLNLRLLLS